MIHPGRKLISTGDPFDVIRHNPNENKSPQKSSHMVSVQGEFISPIKRIIAANENDLSMTTYKKSSKIGINNLISCSEDQNEDDDRIPHFISGKKPTIGG